MNRRCGLAIQGPHRGCFARILTDPPLAPDIVEAVLDGRQPAELGVHVLRGGFPVEWGEQCTCLF